ncbi:leucine-rich repeat domain-containing protein [Aquimarina spinulae]|uniref:leucine-rich repeat domain-containing protein n=1 Tax=Aquimarina spinulae TaxID=1192023 RepID=UPI000D558F88|nr:leucine-rich repeat domain-containing protein [Aquimarina spinulae]
MKTTNISKNNVFKVSSIILLLAIFFSTGCSKDDDNTPEVKSSEKELISFKFLSANNSVLSTDVIASIDNTAKTVIATLPIDTPLSALTPTIDVSVKASFNPTGEQNFTNPLTFTIVAEDRSTTNYSVTITRELSEKGVLQLIVDTNPDNTLDWDLENTTDLNNLNGVTLNAQGNISELDLPNKNLDELPLEIGQLTSLEVLLLGENNLSVLPKEIGLLSSLKVLNLSVNQLTSLPDEISLLTDLEELYLNSNQFRTLPSEIGALTKLIIFSLNNNQLSSIPEEIGALRNLTDLNLNINQLESIPSEIGQLSTLERLILKNNRLTTLPQEIGLLTNLSVLNLGNNQLNSIPAELGFLINLNFLDITNNDLTVVPRCLRFLELFGNPSMDFLHDLITFQSTSQKDALISIYSANPGNTLEWGVDNFPDVDFDANNNPTGLRISNKNLTRLPDFIGVLTSLDIILANNNSIEDIPTSLGNVSPLVVLEFGNNKLATVPSELGQLGNLQLLNLTNNPLINIPTEVCDLQTSNGGILTIISDTGEGCN